MIDADRLKDEISKYAYDTANPIARRVAHDTKALFVKLIDEQPDAYHVNAGQERDKKKCEEKYTIEQILDAITQADEEIIHAIRHKDRGMLEDVIKDYLH